MKQDSTDRRIRRGYAIMAVLVVAVVLVFNSDRIAEQLRDHIDIVAIVHQTQGVRVGSAVRVEGVEAGRVTDIQVAEIGGRGAIALDLRLHGHVRDVVRRGSQVHTARERFVGESMVRISAGATDAPPVEPGDTLYPTDRASLDVLLESGKRFPAQLDSLGTELAELQRLAGDRGPEVRALVERLATVSAEADAFRDQLEGGTIGRWLDDPELRLRIRRLGDHASRLADAADGLRRYGSDGELGQRAALLAGRAERLTTTLNLLRQRLDEGDGILSRMQRDSAIAVAVARVQAQVDSLMADGMGFALQTILP